MTCALTAEGRHQEVLQWALDHGQGLTLVRFPAHLEPCLTHKATLHTLNTP